MGDIIFFLFFLLGAGPGWVEGLHGAGVELGMSEVRGSG
jgi:hypothetical protein